MTRRNSPARSMEPAFVLGGLGLALDAATGLGDLARPGNRLEALRGGRRGQWSIRINDQWRICFEWPEVSPGPAGVEIVDYH